MKPSIPEAALLQHTAILGKTGSGKTSTGKLLVEQVIQDDGARVCILDTVKSDWWGLTSSADGKKPGLPFHILGGPRGHVPLHSSAGKAIAEIVASGELRHSIIDMADFEAGGAQRFFVDFAPALLRNMRGVLYLVIEEAHELAPKERSGFDKENMSVHYAKKLATAGRSKGIRLVVLTQRTQALHNALLGSCETMIVHRLTAPADQEPVLKWLKANASSGVIEMIAAQISSLKTGAGWVCSGEAKIFARTEFPRIKTYDNSATPPDDEHQHEVKTAAVDQEKLRTIIGAAVKEAEANDPKVLRAEIARLKAEAAKRPATTPASPSMDGIANVRATALREGYASGCNDSAAQYKELPQVRADVERVLETLTKTLNSVVAMQTRPLPTMKNAAPQGKGTSLQSRPPPPCPHPCGRCTWILPAPRRTPAADRARAAPSEDRLARAAVDPLWLFDQLEQLLQWPRRAALEGLQRRPRRRQPDHGGGPAGARLIRAAADRPGARHLVARPAREVRARDARAHRRALPGRRLEGGARRRDRLLDHLELVLERPREAALPRAHHPRHGSGGEQGALRVKLLGHLFLVCLTAHWSDSK